ncbi:MAG: type VI secretion system tube protein TssD [Chloroflexota bacterium]
MDQEQSGDPISSRLGELESENRKLREHLAGLRDQSRRGLSRRDLLAGSAGVAVAGAAILGGPGIAAASPAKRGTQAPLGVSNLPTSFRVKVTGTRQGVFAGDLNGDGLPDRLAGLKYDLQISEAYVPGSGLSAGRRQHQPLTIMKEVDKASPMFLQAMVTNEILSQVLLEFPGTLSTGQSTIFYTVVLQNALVVKFHQMVGNVLDPEESNPHELEEISFTYQKITVTWTDGGVTATDDWSR